MSTTRLGCFPALVTTAAACGVVLRAFPAGMQTAALAVPHTWALTAWRNLVFDGGSLGDIAGSVAVLTAWAIGLVTLATIVLRRHLTG